MIYFKNVKSTAFFLWIIIAIWLMLIFSLSAQPASNSNGLSEQVTAGLIQFIATIGGTDIQGKEWMGLVYQYNHFVRKGAHAFIYFILGVLIVATERKSGIKGYKVYVLAVSFCFLYAATDEFHQTFIVGRGGKLSDVLLDTSGAIGGMIVYSLLNIR